MRVERWIPAADGDVSEAELRERLPFQPAGRVTRRRYPPNWYTPAHQHSRESVEVLVAGSLRIAAGNQEVVLAPGDALYLEAEEEHTLEALGEGEAVTLFGLTASGPSADPSLLPRLAGLAVLITLVNWWSTTHLGLELGGLAVVNAILVVLPALAGMLDAKQVHEKRTKQLVRRALSTRVLGLLAVPVLFTTSCVSSLTLEVPANTEVTVQAESSVFGLACGGVVTETRHALKRVPCVLFPTPWRTVRISQKGFLDQTALVLPWRSERIAVAEMTRTPALFVRLDPDRGVFAPEGLLLGVRFNSEEQELPRRCQLNKGKAALLSDHREVDPLEGWRAWDLRLMARESNPQERDHILAGWGNFAYCDIFDLSAPEPCPGKPAGKGGSAKEQRGELGGILQPGVTIEVTVWSRQDICLGRAEVVLGREPLRDIVLPGKGCPS